MNLAQLAKKAAALPAEFEYDWPGPEHWHSDVFAKNVTTLPEAIKYIDQMRERMADYSMALTELQRAYSKMRDVILEMNVMR